MKTCEKCSSPVAEEKAFCPNCGAAMTAERKRTPDYVSEEMGPTMYGYDEPIKNLLPQKPTPPPPPPVEAVAKPVEAEPVKVEPVRAEPRRATAAPASSARQTPSKATVARRPATDITEAPDGNRTLHLILGISAVLFALSILVVAILYVKGKI